MNILIEIMKVEQIGCGDFKMLLKTAFVCNFTLKYCFPSAMRKTFAKKWEF